MRRETLQGHLPFVRLSCGHPLVVTGGVALCSLHLEVLGLEHWCKAKRNVLICFLFVCFFMVSKKEITDHQEKKQQKMKYLLTKWC